jgi:LmbE family N-acetylglucosaminyl deacetylase
MASPVAVVCAHPDDEVLGCGGTMAMLADQGRPVHVLLLADGETARPGPAPGQVLERGNAARRAAAVLGCASVQVEALPDNRLDGVELLDVVRIIEAFLCACGATTVFTHHRGDVNIDHRRVHDAVLAACRPVPGAMVEELLFFEVPSSTEWRPPGSGPVFEPNWFIDISRTLDRKLAALKEYEQELRPFPHPRSLEAVQSLARWRGASAGMQAAEAFMLGRKLGRI